jgi:hypothetical protein
MSLPLRAIDDWKIALTPSRKLWEIRASQSPSKPSSLGDAEKIEGDAVV